MTLQTSKQNTAKLFFQKLQHRELELGVTSYLYLAFVASFFFALHERLFKDLYYLLIALSFIFLFRRGIMARVNDSLVFRSCALFLGYLTFSLLWSPDISARGAYDVGRAFVLILLFLAITIAISGRDPLFHRRLFVALAVVAGLTSVITMVWFYADHDFLRRRLAGFGAIFHPNDVGRLYGIAALSTYFGLVMGGTWGRSKALFIVILALLVAFVVLTGSRGSILALGAAVFAGAVAMRHWALVAAFSLLVVGAVAAAMLGGMGDLNAISRGSSYRSEIWAVVLDRIAERPWFGHGIEADETVPYSRGRAIHAHQMYLSNQFYGGVVATALLALMLAAAGRAAYRDFRSTGSFVLAALLIFVIVAGLFDFGRLLHTVNWVWLVFWLPIALIAGREVCDKAAGQASPQV